MHKVFPLLLVLSLTGCTSFRTTIMQRCSDSRLYPNLPGAKTKGLPVKLKVPTHVEVTVKESFFIQATSDRSPTLSRKAAALAKLAKAAEKRAEDARAKSDADPMNADLRKTALELESASVTAVSIIESGTDPSAPPRNIDCKEIEVCLDGKPIRHFDVETRVIYTDKVFTVDFRRPAGGILNLSTIDMDDEQYFRQVKASYEEQTLKQISGAIGAVTSGISGKSATINGASVSGLATDTRTVAVTRFDISNPDWEQELNAFVEQHVTSCYTDCNYQN